MKYSSLVAFLFVGSSFVTGCAASVDSSSDQGSSSEQASASSAESLTLAQCATQRDACFANNPLFGLFTCPAQYTKCTATASNGLPAQVTNAISDAADCTKTYLACSNDANSASKLAACAATEAECVASIVQVKLPPVVTGTATCVDNSVKCINAAEQVDDLTTCANNLEQCAVGQAQSVLPPQVGQVVGGVATCETTL